MFVFLASTIYKVRNLSFWNCGAGRLSAYTGHDSRRHGDSLQAYLTPIHSSPNGHVAATVTVVLVWFMIGADIQRKLPWSLKQLLFCSEEQQAYLGIYQIIWAPQSAFAYQSLKTLNFRLVNQALTSKRYVLSVLLISSCVSPLSYSIVSCPPLKLYDVGRGPLNTTSSP